MTLWLTTLAYAAIAYLCGSLSSAIIVARMAGLPDPRTQGSGNAGATNVLRMGGKKLALIVFLGDALKGFIPVLVFKMLGLSDPTYLGWIAVAAVLGHMFPILFQFRGGKGVATMVGALLALNWILGLGVMLTWIAIAGLLRYSSLASLIAAASAPIISIWLLPANADIPLLVLALLIIAKHYENIQRLMAGVESKIGEKSR